LPGRTDERVFGMTRILIADDHDVVRRGLRAILRAGPADRRRGSIRRQAGDRSGATNQAGRRHHRLWTASAEWLEVTRQIRERLPKPKFSYSRCTIAMRSCRRYCKQEPEVSC
jgi:DNA-binding NarL/FixJ family response regulator